ncbi:hypothetical protein IQ283_02310 [Alkalihalobacillus hwajinpoensis]|uniref:hypothetical protein n=1 Tax=Guptibacillus hwajinpoensis TaxID=208199 RepID=UPI0018833CE8|nr:hypothetical protein [Pseudalkalibacillus hwajinpoensis]MBF0705424.1 hypothetical protein [Pseudalkalibacillus hwajinpoensis]
MVSEVETLVLVVLCLIYCRFDEWNFSVECFFTYCFLYDPEYFGHKLTIVSAKNITVAQSEDFASRLADEDTLLIVLSVTGKFSSFEILFTETKQHGTDIMLILEECVNTLKSMAVYIFYLSKFNRDNSLLPFEKTRTVFFY